MKALVFIVGPTAVGKTDWALSLAKEDSAGILNADSIQVYKDLNIGSAKPDFKKHPDIPFYLFDTLKAPSVWTAGEFRKQALQVLEKELKKRKMFVVGGSGFYIQALEKGMYPIKEISKGILKNLEEMEKEKGLDFLYKNLQKKDPETASKISSQDRYRILRYLSLIKREGKSIAEMKKEFKAQKLPWPYIKLGLRLPKEVLLKNIQARTAQMLKKGWIEETESLMEKGLALWRPLNSVGYKEIGLYLKGKIQREALEEKIVSGTMALVKKQSTWFKKDKNIKWIDAREPVLKVYRKLFK